MAPATALIRPFPLERRLGHTPPSADAGNLLRRALASLDLALKEQATAVSQFRKAIGGLGGAVGALHARMGDCHDALGTLHAEADEAGQRWREVESTCIPPLKDTSSG